MTKLEVLCPLEVSHYMVSSPQYSKCNDWFAKSIQMHVTDQCDISISIDSVVLRGN